MFCPKCGHKQVSNTAHFCSRCGLQLGAVADLLANTDNQSRREKRELTGVMLMIVTAWLLLIYFTVFGITALPFLAHNFFWTWISFLTAALVVGGFGVFNLTSSGFFKRLKQRQLRLQLELLRKKYDLIEKGAEVVTSGIEHPASLAEPLSVTEATTRELSNTPKTTGNIQ